MLRVLGLGDNVVDKYMHIRTMYPGGNALNFAVYAKMFGIEAGYLGVFGDDEAAAHVYDTIRGLGWSSPTAVFILERTDMPRCVWTTGTGCSSAPTKAECQGNILWN